MREHRATVDRRTLVLLRAVAEATESLGIPWLLTGAGGRILLLEKIYGLPAGRATVDLDFGVMVEDWDQYQRLRAAICRDPRFRPDPKQSQRLRCSMGGYLDLIPFGGVETDDSVVRWPPNGGTWLNVAGFRDACRHAQKVVVNDGACTVPVVTPEGLVVLKLFAWRDRHRAQPLKDAADLAYLLRHYTALLGEERLFDEHLGAVESAGYDLDRAAANVLGRKLARLTSRATRTGLRGILTTELSDQSDSDLVREVAQAMATKDRDRALALLEALRQGLEEG